MLSLHYTFPCQLVFWHYTAVRLFLPFLFFFMANLTRTLVLLKPDTVHRGLIGTVTARIEARGMKIIALKMMTLSNAIIEDHYSFLKEKPFFPEIVSYMTSGPIVAMVVEAEGSVALMRQLCGATNPAEALPGTVRGDLGNTIRYNLIHASDSDETAAVEIKRFFGNDALSAYDRIVIE